MKMNLFRLILLFSASLLVFTSCSKDDGANLSEEKASTFFGAKATFESGRQMENIQITKFLINVEDFELEFDDDLNGDDDDGGGSGGNFYSDIELEGPFELDLSQPDVVFPIVNVEIPIGVYEELEFDIKKNSDSNSLLFQKSILIEGFINESPFVYWHHFEEDVEIDFDDNNIDIIIEQNDNSVVINFDLNFLFNTNTINLSNASDGNADGIIEISPGDNDGNNALANQIKELIKDAIDLLDD